MDDRTIIAMYQKRNPDAVNESDKKYGSYCLAIADHILHSPEDSEECVNDTWLRAWNAIPPQCPRVLRLFFARITRNLSIDRYAALHTQKRGSGETDAVLDELAECIPSGADVEGELLAKELTKAVDRFLRQLPERECNIFLRRYFFTESGAEIADRYGIRENHVSVLLCRTRKKLRLFLEEEGYLIE